MKKKIIGILSFLACSFALTGCGAGSSVSSASSSLSQIDVLREDFYEQWVNTGKMDAKIGTANKRTLEGIGIKVIYGQFRGAYVLSYLVNGMGGDSQWNLAYSVTLNSTSYSFNVSWTPHVWSEGKVVTLEEAYQAKIIVDGDLPEIMRVAAIPLERNLV
jgi:predicted small secreted protein